MPRYAELRCHSCFSFLEGASHPEELVARAAELGLVGARAHRRERALRDRPRARRGEAARAPARGRRGARRDAGSRRAAPARARPARAGSRGVRGAVPARDARARRGGSGASRRRAARATEVARPARRGGRARARALRALPRRRRRRGRAAEGALRRAARARGRAPPGRRARRRACSPRAPSAGGSGSRSRSRTTCTRTTGGGRCCRTSSPACGSAPPSIAPAARLFPNAERTLKGPEEMARLWSDFPEGLEAAARDRRRAAASGWRRSAASTRCRPSSSSAPRSPAAPRRRCRARRRTRAPSRPCRAAAADDADLALADRDRRSRPPTPSATALATATEATATPTASPAWTLLRELVREGARWRYGGEPPDDVARQLARELDLVEQLGYASYFLTVWDIVRFARSRGILCQGRGSAANSAVCYVLGITSIDPVRMGLLFERFISAERGEPPDIDVDFEHERREEVHPVRLRAVRARPRRAWSARSSPTAAKSALRDVGKALGLSLAQVDRLAKLVGDVRGPLAGRAGAPRPGGARRRRRRSACA